MSLSIVRRFGQPKDNDPAGGAGYLTSTIVDNLYHHRWREMNSIPPIVKAGEFVHGANTPRSHLNPHSPPSIPFFECHECVGGGRGRTSHLPAAVSGHHIHCHHRFLKKPVKTMCLGQQLPYHWRQNDTNPSFMMLRRDLSAGDGLEGIVYWCVRGCWNWL
jgi:hypothetical protein